MRKNVILCGLLFAFIFSFSFGFHGVMQAGDNPIIVGPDECINKTHVDNCCPVNEETGQMGVCVSIGPGFFDVVCECTCIHVEWPTCGGQHGCEYDICPIGGGS